MRAVLLTAILVLTAAQAAQAKMEVHEWGTFTSLVGSDGITQNGMYHEDEALPDFVHGFGETRGHSVLPPSPPIFHPPRCRGKGCFGDDFFNRNVVTQKMETPVIYFYSDKREDVSINVRFPEGVLTETYPAPVATAPSSGSVRDAANGNTTFEVEVLPQTSGLVPYVDSHNIYSHARNVASNLVRSGDEQEKFVFYRGIGRFQPRIGIHSEGGNLSLSAGSSADVPQSIFLVDVNAQGQGQLLDLPSMKAGEPVIVSADTIRALKARKVGVGTQQREHLIAGLVQAGLHYDEAAAMLDTWENGYLKVPGLRLLYILPREEVDQVLPLTLSPAPEKLVRAFVGRIEVLLDTDEQATLLKVLKAGRGFDVASLGRFAEPVLRRLKQVYEQTVHDAATLQMFDELIVRAENGEGGVR